MVTTASQAPRTVYTVSQLNQEVRSLLETTLPPLWVEGEISNLARPRSGHLYFTLKDSAAQVRCAMFRNRNLLLRFQPGDGQRVLVRARAGLYPARGEFQLVVDHMEEAGEGALRRAFEALKARLEQEGLFDPAHKRPLPAFPRRLGVITSPTGAAIRDVLTVLRRRFPALPVLIYPVPVQGEGAGGQIAAAIEEADRRRDVDVVLVTRGGGSLEDLWAFNEEVVARAIHACGLPVVSAVGHEVDVTISDLVADQRAPTPSAAAELISPDGPALLHQVRGLRDRLLQLTTQHHRRASDRLNGLARRLQARHPGQLLRDRSQRLDELDQRLRHAMAQRLARHTQALDHLRARLRQGDPRLTIRRREEQRLALERRLHAAVRQQLQAREQRLSGLGRALHAVSPLATLSRGYAIARQGADGPVLRDSTQVAPGDAVRVRLHRGQLDCRVERVHGEPEGGKQ
ncbi:exodeoxyribonuclease VII large subunit [Alkalilimnicola ehrlichii MLHE-1]|uniref:Exodeoxyribonuclease 7 large subunit n=1 Tax=Alkalilimnicola ehrlichii (strain ATCC BAA-1101 / DSM 17681 / MLHE-1) TaxID=187272 RepID=Q0AAU0_ALKEH|nr:exodeoxyribonuclease VII large subunit [Alkalilimnicola ehrlichii]ABI56047.1 Exodeoxyribonuclease VII large subunit [Alkalilimnicola ehrlichii MLHE-1]